jgi:succinate dehydrogenase / fumarate reductase flavoprotein subunit
MFALDSLERRESCGGHFREEMQTEDGEALRDDENFAYVAAWEWTGASDQPKLNKEMLEFIDVKLTQRSYK